MLFSAGLVTFKTRITSKIGAFFVRKKDPRWIHIVIDARIPIFCRRPPPITRLGSASNYIELDLSNEGLPFYSCGDIADFHQTSYAPSDSQCATEADVDDCFYQFLVTPLASWFGIGLPLTDLPLTAYEWRQHGVDIRFVYSDATGRLETVNGSTRLYPCVGAMSVGWSWALFFANEAVSHYVRLSQPGPVCELRERLPVPQLSQHRTVTSTYVDNISILGRSSLDVSRHCGKTDAHFKRPDFF